MNTHTFNLGRLDLGNNHHTGHLMQELAKVPDLYDQLRHLPSRDDARITYGDKYGNKYADTWDVGELCTMMKPHAPEMEPLPEEYQHDPRHLHEADMWGNA